MTDSPIQGVLSEVPGWPLRDPLRDPFRDPRTSQKLSGLLTLFLLPHNLSPRKAHFAARKKSLENRRNEVKLRPSLCRPLKHSMILLWDVSGWSPRSHVSRQLLAMRLPMPRVDVPSAALDLLRRLDPAATMTPTCLKVISGVNLKRLKQPQNF